MSGHFRLDVDPEGLREAAREITAAAGRISGAANRLHGSLGGVEASFQGDASKALRTETEHLAGLTARSAPDVGSAAKALTALASAYETARDETVPRLNRQWEEAEASHSQAVAGARIGLAPPMFAKTPEPFLAFPADRVKRADEALSAEQARLTREFDALRDDLRARTRAAGAAMGRATIVPVSASMVANYTAGGLLGPLLRMVMDRPDAWTALAGQLPLTALSHALSSPPGPEAGSAALGKLVDEARALQLRPEQYAGILSSYYQALALERAGIDFAKWKPALGADANREIIYAVYTYYGKLFLQHPNLQWAGLANMVGGAFGSAFFDLGSIRDFARKLDKILGVVGVDDPRLRGIQALAGASEQDLKFFETTFLTMQQKIFLDMGGMHEAYLKGGLPAMKEMLDAGLIDDKTFQAWTYIDTGTRTDNQSLLVKGAVGMAYREQWPIIEDDYDRMRHYHGAVGEGFTYAISMIGAPTIPGAHTFADVFPLHVRIPVGIGPKDFSLPPSSLHIDNPFRGTVDVRTPLPDGNVSDRNDRWALIVKDTFPAYERDLVDDPAGTRAMIASPVQDRIAQHRLVHQFDDILERMTHVSVSIHE